MQKIEIIIDHREGKLKDIFYNCKDYNISFANLEHGDIQILLVDETTTTPMFVFERKSIQDLQASIHDGRYRNQKQRMVETYGTNKVYYIFEGVSDTKNIHGHSALAGASTGASTGALAGALVNTVLRDKICVFQTKDVSETAQL